MKSPAECKIPSLTRTDVVDTFDMRLALHHAIQGAAAIRGAILSAVERDRRGTESVAGCCLTEQL